MSSAVASPPARVIAASWRCAGERSNVYQALVTSGLFSRTDPNIVSAVSRELRPRHFRAGRVVDTRTDLAGRLYIVVSGKAMLHYRRLDGCQVLLAVVGPPETFGATSIFDGESGELSVTALTDVTAVPIERDQLLSWMATRPEVADQVLRLFARRAKAAIDCLVDFRCNDAASRIAARLLCLSQRFGRREGEVVRVVHDMTLADFAAMVGVAPQAVAATLREFTDRGWLYSDATSFVIVDGQALASVRAMNAPEICHV
ncbi:Crp/Fnr family transcriptional regulator [Mycobacterium kubicae]|nr:Crp/Fnr family transcriptional regulator [Mycobacterium kubicae]